jgi:NAD(P)-dependent dehydrogenase (short-subunit alcohol dehydrogenase family)
MKLPIQIDLQGKVIVVTGAGGILCSMFSKAVAQCGAKVALLDLNLEAAQKYADEITKEGYIAKAYACNVLEKESLIKVREQIHADLGTCDILINGAGGNNPRATTTKEYYEAGDAEREDITTFFNLDKSGVEFVFDINFMGTLLPSQVFALDMLDKGDASILNISSMNAYTPLTKIPAYSGAKAAISNFTQWLAVHFAKQGIRVNAIAPGFFVSNQNRGLLFTESGEPTPRTHKILNSTPMGRFGEADELIGPLLFLLSQSAASFITGVVLPVDGGFSAYSGV